MNSVQPDEYWYCFEGSLLEITERPAKAHNYEPLQALGCCLYGGGGGGGGTKLESLNAWGFVSVRIHKRAALLRHKAQLVCYKGFTVESHGCCVSVWFRDNV